MAKTTATYVLVTLKHGSIIAVEPTNTSKWYEALDALNKAMCEDEAEGLRISIKGTWRPPYAKFGTVARATSYSAYTRGYSHFTYIKKVSEGEEMPEVGEEKSGRDTRSFTDLIADCAGVRRPRNAEERAELEHCWEMGDFDY